MKIFILLILLSISISARERYEIYCNAKLLELSVRIAHSEVGTMEMGENRGAVEKYHRAMGIKRGLPYCAAGLYYCFKKGVDSLKLNDSEIPIIRNPLANAIFFDSKKRGKKTVFGASRNDLLVWRKGKSMYGHIEWIIAVERAGYVRTIGFNVKSPENPRIEGVFYRKRNIYAPLARMYVRGLIGFSHVQ